LIVQALDSAPLSLRAVDGMPTQDEWALIGDQIRGDGGRLMDLPQLTAEAMRLSALIDKGVAALRDASVAYAKAEHAYRERKAMAYLETESGTVAEREAHVYAIMGDYRYRRDLADGERMAALEAVRSRRTQLSAVQSLLAAHKSEADFARTGSR
jgi:hypothetical protein